MRLVRVGFRLGEEGRDWHAKRLGQAVEEIDGGVALFPLKLADPGSVDSSVDRQPPYTRLNNLLRNDSYASFSASRCMARVSF